MKIVITITSTKDFPEKEEFKSVITSKIDEIISSKEFLLGKRILYTMDIKEEGEPKKCMKQQ